MLAKPCSTPKIVALRLAPRARFWHDQAMTSHNETALIKLADLQKIYLYNRQSTA